MVPKLLLTVWANEIADKTNLKMRRVLVYHGPNRHRLLTKVEEALFVLTTSETLISDAKEELPTLGPGKKAKITAMVLATHHLRTNLFGKRFYRLVCDEAHNWKNPQAAGTLLLSCMADRVQRVFCVSGTPYINKVDDLAALCTLVGVAPFSDPSWWKRNMADERGTSFVSWRDGDARHADPVFRQGFLLRRTKEVLNLPPLVQHVVRVGMEPDELYLYHSLVGDVRAAYSNYARFHAGQGAYMMLLQKITRLRQLGVHPSLIAGAAEVRGSLCAHCGLPRAHNAPSGWKCAHKACSDCFEEFAQAEGPAPPCPTCAAAVATAGASPTTIAPPTSAVPTSSGSSSSSSSSSEEEDTEENFLRRVTECKLESSSAFKVLLRIVRATKQQNSSAKITIFSQWSTVLGLVKAFLVQHGMFRASELAELHGDSKADREEEVRRFQQDPGCKCILIGLKAGGVGITLTAGTVAILMDLWWNRPIEDQAIGRVYRLGQTQRVDVYRIVVEHSIGEWVQSLQDSKEKDGSRVMGFALVSQAKQEYKSLVEKYLIPEVYKKPGTPADEVVIPIPGVSALPAPPLPPARPSTASASASASALVMDGIKYTPLPRQRTSTMAVVASSVPMPARIVPIKVSVSRNLLLLLLLLLCRFVTFVHLCVIRVEPRKTPWSLPMIWILCPLRALLLLLLLRGPSPSPDPAHKKRR